MTRSLCTLFDPSIAISTNLMIRIRWSRSLLPAAGMIELLAESEGVPDIVEGNDNWTEKCIYCERDEEAKRRAGECVRDGVFMEAESPMNGIVHITAASPIHKQIT
jgi:hypothetical protein